jgi:hypothetical protein
MKVISLNIEGNKHYELVLPFLHTENPDVICLQEVLEDDVNMFFSEFPEMIGTFKPFTYYGSKHERYASMSGKIFGNLVLAKNAYTTDSFYSPCCTNAAKPCGVSPGMEAHPIDSSPHVRIIT